MKKLLVTGVNGQLGHFVKKYLSAGLTALPLQEYQVDYSERVDFDLASSKSIQNYFSKAGHFDTILNLAAYTQVDKAEQERDQAWQINAVAPAELARYCERLIHVSTDYVYGGDKRAPYSEQDPTVPVNFYGESKLQGELNLLKSDTHAVIVRTAWLYSELPGNFLTKISDLARQRPQLKIVSDQMGTPTYAGDLARVLIQIVAKGAAPGIYNYSNEGVTNWYEFARFFLDKQGIQTPVSPIATNEYPTLAKRPQYAVLDKSKIKNELGLTIPQWQESVEVCLRNLQKQS